MGDHEARVRAKLGHGVHPAPVLLVADCVFDGRPTMWPTMQDSHNRGPWRLRKPKSNRSFVIDSRHRFARLRWDWFDCTLRRPLLDHDQGPGQKSLGRKTIITRRVG